MHIHSKIIIKHKLENVDCVNPRFLLPKIYWNGTINNNYCLKMDDRVPRCFQVEKGRLLWISHKFCEAKGLR